MFYKKLWEIVMGKNEYVVPCFVRRLAMDSEADKKAWADFVFAAKNSTFMLQRDFMDYHAHRFADHSLLIFDQNNQLAALLPAHQINNQLHSHQGLTYGGLILPFYSKIQTSIDIWQAIIDYCKTQNIAELYYKALPSFYQIQAANEEQYALFLQAAQIYRVDTAFVIDNRPPNSIDTFDKNIQTRRKRAIQKAKKLNVVAEKAADCSQFWTDILVPNLAERFGVAPVHSLDEIENLRQKFPKQIQQFNAYLDGEIVAGATIFITDTTAHAQYISANKVGRDSGAIDLLFYELITLHFVHLPFFSFGIANENQGKNLNQGLTDWKEGFGAQVYPHLFYKIKTL
jgi:hypothetical protein